MSDTPPSHSGYRRILYRLRIRSQHGWLFRRPITGWLQDPAKRAQLPWPYRLFAAWTRLALAVYKGKGIPLGRLAFAVARGLYICSRKPVSRGFQTENGTVFLHWLDPRFLQVVNEVEMRADTRILPELLPPGGSFVDVGSNHGAFSIVAAGQVGHAGHILAVEPQPLLAGLVQQSLDANHSGAHRVLQAALGDKTGTISLHVPSSYSGAAGVFTNQSAQADHQVFSVPLLRFDDVPGWQELPEPVVVKIDIEGSESNFLRGAQAFLQSKKPILILEISRASLLAAGTNVQALVQLLQITGYTEYAELNQHQTWQAIEQLHDLPERNILLRQP